MNRHRARRDTERWRPTFEALARATCPPDGLTDDLVEATAAEVAVMVDSVGPAARRALLWLATLLENSSRLRGRPKFSGLEPSVAGKVFKAHRQGPLGPLFSLLRDVVVVAFYEQPSVREALGYAPDPFIAEKKAERLEKWSGAIEDHRRLLITAAPLREPLTRDVRAQGQIQHGSFLPDGCECDVVIVGSGAGGGVMAAELAEAGLSVVVLEEGDHHETDSFSTSTTGALRSLYRDGGVATTVGRAPIGYTEGRCVGGGTVVNGGMAFRASERILERWAAVSGDQSLLRGGLDEAYSRVERFLSVNPPDAGSVGRDQELLRFGAERLGWRVVEDTRNHLHCGGCNVCTWGCPTGAKQSTLESYLPRAIHFGANVWHGCRVDYVMMAGKKAIGVRGRIVSAESRSAARQFQVRARRVVVCAGAMQTPALLQRSRIRCPSRYLGRNLTVHPGAGVVAVFDEDVEGWKGAHQSLQIREFESEGIVLAAVNMPPSLVARSLRFDGSDLGEVMANYNRIVMAGVLVEDSAAGRVRAIGSEGVIASYAVNDNDVRRVTRAVSLLSEVLFEAGARTIHLPFAGRGPLHNGGDLRRLEAIPVRPSDIALVTVHLMGTARMGIDPTWAVSNPHGEVFDTVGLSVADASLFPGPVGVNPMLTVMALATRAAARIVDTW